MSLIKDIKEIKKDIKDMKDVLIFEDELTSFEKEYKEYKFFADARGMKLLADRELVDEYNKFMTEYEEILFPDFTEISAKKLPKPSPELEAFKNKFNKFFK